MLIAFLTQTVHQSYHKSSCLGMSQKKHIYIYINYNTFFQAHICIAYRKNKVNKINNCFSFQDSFVFFGQDSFSSSPEYIATGSRFLRTSASLSPASQCFPDHNFHQAAGPPLICKSTSSRTRLPARPRGQCTKRSCAFSLLNTTPEVLEFTRP